MRLEKIVDDLGVLYIGQQNSNFLFYSHRNLEQGQTA